jgi:transposase
MLSLATNTRIFLCVTPVDMRRSFDTLAGLVQDFMDEDPMLCGEPRYVAADREHVTKRLIRWLLLLRPATHKIYRLSSRLRTASFG